MKDRIKQIMDSENMSPARFADSLDIGRAVISHILNGRNNPSLDVMTRILLKMPQIDTDWLLTGIGSMYKIEAALKNESKLSDVSIPDLFSQLPHENLANTTKDQDKKESVKENIVEMPQNTMQQIVNERIIYKEAPTKKIKQIIIYYNDNTFETFNNG